MVVPVAAGFTTGTRYTLVTATGGVTGSFSGVSTASPLLAPSLSYDGNDAYVTLGQLSLTTALTGVGGTGNQRATAAGYDLAEAANAGAYAASLAAFDTLSAAGVRASLDRLSGESYTGFATTALQSGALFAGQVQHQAVLARLGASDGPEGQVALAAGNRVQLASLSGDGSDSVTDPVAALDRPWGVWLSGYGQTGQIAGDGNAHRLSETIAGASIGVDYKIDPSLRIGAALGAGGTNFSLDNGGGHGQVDRTQVALYADYTAGPAYLDGMLGVGYGDGRMRRDVSLPGLPALAFGQR